MTTAIDAIELEILRNQLESVAEEMGEVLVRGAFSPNITERRDCSTALFDADGRLVAQAEHIPVHLGAMPEAVDAVLESDPAPGDVFVLNDPFAGGTHLPDVTLVSPISEAPRASAKSSGQRGGDAASTETAAPSPSPRDRPDADEIVGYAVSRAHHADVGGMAPGSMPAGAREIQQEGLRIPPTRLVADGERCEPVWGLLEANVRNPAGRRADLRAQLGANRRGAERVGELLSDHGERLLAAFDAVRAYSRKRIAAELREFPDGTYTATDRLEGDGVTDADIPIEVAVTVDGATLDVDFSGTGPQVAGNVNAPLSVAKSAVYFAVRSVTDPDVPPNGGCYEPISVHAPSGCLLNPAPPAAVVGGNVETSQRVADVLFRALAEAVPDRVPAAGQGTMNNLVVGGPEFSYYETIGGGMGASRDADGPSGVQVGMTNTLNTPIEALELAYPLRAEQYGLRRDSGGAGRHDGGDGLVRELTVETDATVSLLTERRRTAPWGLAGGAAGAVGENYIDGEAVPSKVTREVEAGTTVRIETPGGGGHGDPET